jgi:glycosyltransferase involved in cell wall biosynthesis
VIAFLPSGRQALREVFQSNWTTLEDNLRSNITGFLMSLVSVVISTFNSEPYLRQTLESVFNQTVLPSEIIISDDCSRDNTCELVKSIAKDSPVQIRLIESSEPSGGPSRPLNIGIAAAIGKYIAPFDHDDLMGKDKIALQVEALESRPECILAIGRFSVVGRDPNDLTELWSVSQFEELIPYLDESKDFSVVESSVAFPPLLRRNYAATSSNYCFSKERWHQLGGFNENINICNDLEFMLRATLKGPIAVIHKHLFEYRISASSLLRKDVTRSLLEATMVRLRAASLAPELAGSELEALRYSAMMLGTATLRKGDFNGFQAMVETMIRYRGASTINRTVKNKVRRLKRISEPSGKLE